MKLSPRYDGPAILSIEGSPDDQRVPVTRQRHRMESLLASLTDDEWKAPSRCDGWSVQDVVAHLVGVNAFWQASVAAGLAGTPTRLLVQFDPAATPPLMVEPMRALSGNEILGQFVTSNDGFLDVLSTLDTSGWSTLAESPAGHVPIRLLAQHALWDAWVHERDIALPLGRDVAAEPDEIASCLRYAAAVGPALSITSGTGVVGELAVDATDPDVCFTLAVGDSVEVRDGSQSADTPCLRGSAVELVEMLSIRAPVPAGTPDAWRQLVLGLATVFDSVT